MLKQKQEKGRRYQDVAVSIVQAGDLQALQNLLSGKGKKEIDDPIGELGLTLLHLAAVFNQVEITRWLLENKAKPDKKESLSGKTPLHVAAYYGRMDILELLLNHSKGFSSDKAECFPIHYACMQEDLEVVRKLTAAGSDLNRFSSIGTPLDIAIRKKNFPLADFLSSNIGEACLLDEYIRKEVVFRSRDRLSPVHLAIASAQKDIATALLYKFPQFPSKELKNSWKENRFSGSFFCIPSRGDFLELFYSSKEIPEIRQSVNSRFQYYQELFRERGILSDLFLAVLEGDLNNRLVA